MNTVECARCKRTESPPEKVPYPGALGNEIQSSICHLCWAEWEGMEVMVINELKLNFMDPAAMDTLVQHMREFLCLTTTPTDQG